MPTLKSCTVCGKPSKGARCKLHARPRRQLRGYDAAYDRALRSPAFLAATHCVECREPFGPDRPKTGGHVKAVRHGGTTADGIVPMCAPCNYGDNRDL